MLVLTRKRGQAIKIGDDVVITVTEIRGKGSKSIVKLGITAPPGTKVLREEVEREVAQEMDLAKDPAFDISLLGDKVKEQ
ncbi:MAG TPA: carbon storage regulator [Firmicutes bacterium]|nr:carbon storage regulator [Candidatus Fermentithermobacillaceae bacterium]